MFGDPSSSSASTRTPVSTRPLQPFDKGYTHFCVDVTDIDREYERLKTLGMTFGAPHPIDAGHVKSVTSSVTISAV